MAKFILCTLAICFALAVSLPNASADVLYSNLAAPGGTYDSGAGHVFLPGVTIGSAFTMTLGGTLTDIGIALQHVRDSTSVSVSLFTDGGGSPGALLESWNVTATTPFTGSDNALVNLVSINSPFLAAGTTYWVIASAAGDGVNVWNVNSIGALGPLYDNGSIVSGAIEGAIRIDGTPVPEPASMLLLGAGLIGAAGSIRRKLFS